jgi:hypothetical protein|uniref:Uncharacterized protein n=1 Tax=Phaeodactylum tricornutum TaxID=2850 RepID=A0A8J9X5C4_PHATR
MSKLLCNFALISSLFVSVHSFAPYHHRTINLPKISNEIHSSSTIMSGLPSPHNLAGKLIPTLPGIPSSSISSVVSSYPGDLVLIAFMACLPLVLNEILNDVIPKKFRSFTNQFDAAARISGILYGMFLFDAVFAHVLGRQAVVGKQISSVLFLLAWWLPSRLSIVRLVKPKVEWMQNGSETERGLLNRLGALAVYLGATVVATNSLSMSVSQAMGYAVMPALVAILK